MNIFQRWRRIPSGSDFEAVHPAELVVRVPLQSADLDHGVHDAHEHAPQVVVGPKDPFVIAHLRVDREYPQRLANTMRGQIEILPRFQLFRQ